MSYTVDYAKNPDKTTGTNYCIEFSDGTKISSLSEVIKYAAELNKTNILDEDGLILKEYVTSINCNKDTAFEEMMLIKRKYGKMDRILAWHGYQSFKPGEVTADEAHQIGIELAESLWGDRFQVVVTTHLDRAHIHNHFVVNSVSFLDGYKFYANVASYFKMREESDRLCMEHGLSVIEEPTYNGVKRGGERESGKSKSKSKGRYTMERIVREDIDRIILSSIDLPDFISKMGKSGYKINAEGKYVTVFPYGHSRGIRINRRWGESYSMEGIAKQIELNRLRGDIRRSVNKRAGVVRKPTMRICGYRALYIRFLHRIGAINKTRGYTNKQMHFVMREELLKLNTLKGEMDFIRLNKIESLAGLERETAKRKLIYEDMVEKRQKLRNKIRRAAPEKRQGYIDEADALTEEIGKLRKELFYCNDIKYQSEKMERKMTMADELMQEKEVTRIKAIKEKKGTKDITKNLENEEGGVTYGRLT